MSEELQKPYILQLASFIEQERSSGVIVYPPKDLVFNALLSTPYEKVRVVIVGQDPYHGKGQAHGLSFSVSKGSPLPPSLQNIYKELVADVGIPYPKHGCLISWAEQGVMLLNATLTVVEGKPMSHHGKGWEKFTDAILRALRERKEPVIFVLWGKSAQEKCRFLQQTESKHSILIAPHPSPLSAHQGFLGCHHFSKVNELLVQQGNTPIDWTIH